MNSTQIEALFVRHAAAIQLLKDKELDPWQALAFVLIPTEDVYRASMTVAEESGPSTRAKELAESRIVEPEQPRTRAKRLPRRMQARLNAQGRTLDEVLAGR